MRLLDLNGDKHLDLFEVGDNREFLICMTDDSRVVGMPISFMCACVKFVILSLQHVEGIF